MSRLPSSSATRQSDQRVPRDVFNSANIAPSGADGGSLQQLQKMRCEAAHVESHAQSLLCHIGMLDQLSRGLLNQDALDER